MLNSTDKCWKTLKYAMFFRAKTLDTFSVVKLIESVSLYFGWKIAFRASWSETLTSYTFLLLKYRLMIFRRWIRKISLILNAWSFKIRTFKNKRKTSKVGKTCYFRLRLQKTIHYIPIWSSCGALSNYTCGFIVWILLFLLFVKVEDFQN